MAGSESVAGRRKCLYRNLGEPEHFKKLLKSRRNVMKQYVALAVGLIHSRGVNRVMPVENNTVHSKGLAV